jgi:hypothetical protein
MKKGIVKFSKEYVTVIGLKEWVGIEMEYDMNTECPRDVLTNAKTVVEQWHNSNNLPFEQNSVPPGPPQVIQVKPEDREIGVTSESIMSSPDLKVLETYRWLIKGKPELERAYILRYDQLTTLTTNQ